MMPQALQLALTLLFMIALIMGVLCACEAIEMKLDGDPVWVVAYPAFSSILLITIGLSGLIIL